MRDLPHARVGCLADGDRLQPHTCRGIGPYRADCGDIAGLSSLELLNRRARIHLQVPCVVCAAEYRGVAVLQCVAVADDACHQAAGSVGEHAETLQDIPVVGAGTEPVARANYVKAHVVEYLV